ncbi:hypothetical protein BSKO_10621 [Bryopsis sp. KO-2023]|nr:hypothetical protein BSKO_10621 [Bryopsis sp. KO-2023]
MHYNHRDVSRAPSTSSAGVSVASFLDETGTPIIPSSHLTLVDHENPLGRGSFGVVFRGIAYKEDVAIKMLFEKPENFASPEDSIRVIESLCDEVKMLADLNHTNVISFKGVCLDPPCIVTEYCPRGSVYDVLKKLRASAWDESFGQSQSSKSSRRRKKKMKFNQKLKIALGIAKGMYFLHRRSRPVLHRDLKSPNVVLREDWTAVVTDFGMARYKPARLEFPMNPMWLSPEMMNNEEPCEKSDVFSFAIIMWELLTGHFPWDGRRYEQIQCAVLLSNQRPEIPQGMVNSEAARAYVKLMERCWSRNREDRPNFDEIEKQLWHIYQGFRPNQATAAPSNLMPLSQLAGPYISNANLANNQHAAPADPSLSSPPNGSTEVPPRKPNIFLKLITCGVCGGGEMISSPPPGEQSLSQIQPTEQAPHVAPPQGHHRPSPFERPFGAASTIKEEDESLVTSTSILQNGNSGRVAGNTRSGQGNASGADGLGDSDEEEEIDLPQSCSDMLFTRAVPRGGELPAGARSGGAPQRGFRFRRPRDVSADAVRGSTQGRSGGGGNVSGTPLGVVGTVIPSRDTLQLVYDYITETVASDTKRGVIWEEIIKLAQGWRLNGAEPVDDVRWREFLAVFFGNCGGDKKQVQRFRFSTHWEVLRRHLVEDLIPEHVSGQPPPEPAPDRVQRVEDSTSKPVSGSLPMESSLGSSGFDREVLELLQEGGRPSTQNPPPEHFTIAPRNFQPPTVPYGGEGGVYGVHHSQPPPSGGQPPHVIGTYGPASNQPHYPQLHYPPQHQPAHPQHQLFQYGMVPGPSQGSGNPQVYPGNYLQHSQGGGQSPPGDGVI